MHGSWWLIGVLIVSLTTLTRLTASSQQVIQRASPFFYAHPDVIQPTIHDAAMDLAERATAPAGVANTGRIFMRDNGSGRTQACVQFGSGDPQCFATEP